MDTISRLVVPKRIVQKQLFSTDGYERYYQENTNELFLLQTMKRKKEDFRWWFGLDLWSSSLWGVKLNTGKTVKVYSKQVLLLGEAGEANLSPLKDLLKKIRTLDRKLVRINNSEERNIFKENERRLKCTQRGRPAKRTAHRMFPREKQLCVSSMTLFYYLNWWIPYCKVAKNTKLLFSIRHCSLPTIALCPWEGSFFLVF